MHRPNLFIVGEQKSGTSALHNYLSKHPDIFMSKLKEPAFFATDIIEDSIKFHKKNLYYHYNKLDKYLELFQDANKQKYIGESSSVYLYSEDASKNIHKFNPDSKIIIMFREPVSFLNSLFLQYKKETVEDQDSLSSALKIEDQRKEYKGIPKHARSPKLLFYSERVKYLQNIKRYTELFPHKNILVLTFDEFVSDNTATLEKVTKFLGINKLTNLKITKTNTSSMPRFENLHGLINNPRFKNAIIKIMPITAQAKIKEYSSRLLLKKVEVKPEDKKLNKTLKEKYSPTIPELTNYLQKNALIEDDLFTLWY